MNDRDPRISTEKNSFKGVHDIRIWPTLTKTKKSSVWAIAKNLKKGGAKKIIVHYKFKDYKYK